MPGNEEPPRKLQFMMFVPPRPRLAFLSAYATDAPPEGWLSGAPSEDGRWVEIHASVSGIGATPVVCGGSIAIGTRLNSDGGIEKGYEVFSATLAKPAFPPASYEATFKVWIPGLAKAGFGQLGSLIDFDALLHLKDMHRSADSAMIEKQRYGSSSERKFVLIEDEILLNDALKQKLPKLYMSLQSAGDGENCNPTPIVVSCDITQY
jgi:hypothetical protein